MKNLSTNLTLGYLSNNLSNNLIDNKVFEQTEVEKLSQMICKTLELTSFIEDNCHYRLFVEKESDTVLYFKITKYV